MKTSRTCPRMNYIRSWMQNITTQTQWKSNLKLSNDPGSSSAGLLHCHWICTHCRSSPTTHERTDSFQVLIPDSSCSSVVRQNSSQLSCLDTVEYSSWFTIVLIGLSSVLARSRRVRVETMFWGWCSCCCLSGLTKDTLLAFSVHGRQRTTEEEFQTEQGHEQVQTFSLLSFQRKICEWAHSRAHGVPTCVEVSVVRVNRIDG